MLPQPVLSIRFFRNLFLSVHSYLPTLLIIPFLVSCSTPRKLPAKLSDALPPLPESRIGIPVKIYAKPFLDKAETLVPPEFTSAQWPDYILSGCDFRYKYRFVRSQLRFSCTGSRVQISVTGSYQVAGSKSICVVGRQVSPWISGSCGFNNEPLRRVNITIGSTLRFLPDYTVRSQSAIETIQPVDKCSVTLLNTDITSLVMNTVRAAMQEFAASLDHDIARLSIAPVIRKVETGIGKQIVLGQYGFLTIRPVSLQMGKINYAGDTVYLNAGFSCYPELSSDGAGRLPRVQLPPLTNKEMPEGVSLYANASYAYPFVSRLLTQAARQQVFTLRGEQVRVDSIAVRALGNHQVELRAAFSGSRSGVLYLTGTPVLDPVGQTISVPDLSFSLHSKSVVLNAGKTFFNKRILRALRRQAVISIPTLYQQYKPALDQALRYRFSPNIFSTGTTTGVSLTGFVALPDRMLLQASLQAHAALTVGL